MRSGRSHTANSTRGRMESPARSLGAGDRESAPVALLLPQSTASVVGIIAALKSASPYVSLDPSDPRRAALIEHVGATAVLTDAKHAPFARALPGKRQVVVVDETEHGCDPGIGASPEDVAYVFFTSGSTGKPKGVYDSHRNVLHNVLRYTNTLRITPADRLSLIQSPSFSGTVSTLFTALPTVHRSFPFVCANAGFVLSGAGFATSSHGLSLGAFDLPLARGDPAGPLPRPSDHPARR